MKAKKGPPLAPYELQKMALSPGVGILFFGYLLIFAAAVCFPKFRDAYLHLQEGAFLPFWAFGGVLPVFVTLTLILGISPLFAGDVQSRTREEFSTCARGRGALCRARVAAVFLFAALVNFAYTGTAFLFGLLWGGFPKWSKGIETVYPGVKFKMAVGAYCALAALLIFSGSLAVAALTAYASARSKTAVAPCAAAVLFLGAEYAFQKLGGANPMMDFLSNVNVCKAMNPAANLYAGQTAPFDSPARAAEILLLSLAVAVGLTFWRSARWRRGSL